MLEANLTGESKKGIQKTFSKNLSLSELNQTKVDSFCTHMVKQNLSTL